MPAFTQQVDASTVRRETLDGREYAVVPINILKPMALNAPAGWDVDEAYLPREEAQASAPLWNGTPLTLNHPTANGTGTTANSPQMHERSVMGRVFNATFDESSGFVSGEAWFDIEKARSMGGPAEAALDRVLNGETVEVSSGYRPSRLSPGEYDGESRTAVQGEIRPDHVAVLPNTEGKCSVDAEGCGVGAAVANELAVTNAALAPDAPDAPDDASDTPEETDVPDDTPSTDTTAAENGDEDSPETDAADTASSAEDVIRWLRRHLGVDSDTGPSSDTEGDGGDTETDRTGTIPAESGEDSPAEAANADGGTDSMDNRDDLIEEITANSPITAASLEDACDERVDLLHEDVMSENDEGGADDDDEEETETETEATNDGEFEALRETINGLAETVGEMQDQMVTEADLAENERADLVEDILANSDEFGEDDREELEATPEAVLNRIHDDVTEPSPVANFAAARGASAAPATNDDTPDADDLVMFEGDL